MAKEAKVGIKISTSQAQNDIKQLSASLTMAMQAFEQANKAATQQENILRQLATDMKKTASASVELKNATLQEKQSKIESNNALAKSRIALAMNREETAKLTSAKVALATQNLKNKQSTEALKQARIANTNALKQQRLAQASLIKKKEEMLVQSKKLSSSTTGITNRFIKLKSVIAAFAVGMGLRSVVQTLTDFEYTMQRLGFITKATGAEFQTLMDTARQLGATTQYTAADAAKGMQFLGLVGLNTQQVIATIPSVLNLATSASIDMATSADITAKAMTAFGISAEETNRIADVMVQTMTSANTTVIQLGDAFKFVGPIAHASGLSLEDAAAAVGAVSDAGIQASLAGTGLRRSIQALLNPTVKAEKALRILGLSVDDVSTKYNSLDEVVSKLQKAGLGDLPELSFEIFGLRGAPVIQALISNIDKFRDLKKSYEDTVGVAKEGADVLNNTLRATFKRLTSVVQEATIATGESGLLWALRQLVETSTSVIRVLTGIGDASEKASILVNSLAMGFRVLVSTAILQGLAKLVSLFKTVMVAGAAASSGGFPFFAIGAALALATPHIIEATKAVAGFIDKEDEYVKKTDEIRQSTLEGADAFKTMMASVEDISFSGDLSGIEALTNKLSDLTSESINTKQGLSENIEDGWLYDMAEMLEDTTKASNEYSKELETLKKRYGSTRQFWIKSYNLEKEAMEKVKEESTSLAKAIEVGLNSTYEFSGTMIEAAKATETFDSRLSKFVPVLSEFFGVLYEGNSKISGGISGSGDTELAVSVKGIIKLMDELKIKYQEGYAEAGKLEEISKKRASTIETLRKAVKDGLASEKDIAEANRLFDLWANSITSKSTKAADKVATRLARDRERITDTLMKTILPEYELDYREIMENVAEAQRVGVEAQTIATYKRMALQDLEEERLKDFVDAYEDEIKLQERAGVITKEMAVEALQALLPTLSATSEEYLTLSKAIEKYNESISRDVERDKRKQIEYLKEALGTIHQEFDVGKFEVLSDSDMAMQRDALETLLERVKQLKGDTPGLIALIKKLRDEIDNIPDETNKAKEATQEWMHSFEQGITQAIMGAESLADAFSNLANQIAEYMINMALWGASGSEGLLGGLLGGLFGRATGGPVQKGQAYIVGEQRPELFVPQTSGQIIQSVPNTGYQSNINVSVNIETTGEIDEAQSAKIGKIVADTIDKRQMKNLKRENRSGGMLNRPYSGVTL